MLVLAVGLAAAGTATGAPTREAPRTFRIGGSVDGLFPGGATFLTLRLTNPEAFAIEVRHVEGTVERATAGCPTEVVSVGRFEGAVVVPRRGEATVSVPVAMAEGADDACRGARFDLAYQGTAVRAR